MPMPPNGISPRRRDSGARIGKSRRRKRDAPRRNRTGGNSSAATTCQGTRIGPPETLPNPWLRKGEPAVLPPWPSRSHRKHPETSSANLHRTKSAQAWTTRRSMTNGLPGAHHNTHRQGGKWLHGCALLLRPAVSEDRPNGLGDFAHSIARRKRRLLPSLRGRYGDPGLASRLTQFEMNFRRLLASAPQRWKLRTRPRGTRCLGADGF